MASSPGCSDEIDEIPSFFQQRWIDPSGETPSNAQLGGFSSTMAVLPVSIEAERRMDAAWASHFFQWLGIDRNRYPWENGIYPRKMARYPWKMARYPGLGCSMPKKIGRYPWENGWRMWIF